MELETEFSLSRNMFEIQINETDKFVGPFSEWIIKDSSFFDIIKFTHLSVCVICLVALLPLRIYLCGIKDEVTNTEIKVER